jgi:hypothetical protein
MGVMFLARLLPQFAREISASKVPADSDISALVPVQVRQFEAGLDLHEEIVILRLHDDSEGVFDFSFVPTRAHEVGVALNYMGEAGRKRTKTY